MLKLGDYSKCSDEDVVQDIVSSYCVNLDLVSKFEILIAQLNGDGGYEESSFFLLRDKETGMLHENHASHCSCGGFEGQFEPKETTVTYLKSEHFYFYGDEMEQVKAFFETL